MPVSTECAAALLLTGIPKGKGELKPNAYELGEYRIYSINRPGCLLNFWTLPVGLHF